jgi:esterase/lipase
LIEWIQLVVMDVSLFRNKIIRRGFLTVGILIVVAAVVFVAGPRVDTSYRPKKIELPANLDGYFAQTEAAVQGLVPGAEKKIVWASPDKHKTPISVVYIHGFSATRQETAPLAERVAAALGANLFFTRLTGHGLDGDALARATVNDWLNDAHEALRVGERIGDKVLVIGCSSGAALSAWLAANTSHENVLAYVLLSPNLWPKNPDARFLLWPWARQIMPRIHQPQVILRPLNEQHARYWNTHYPLVALIPMMGLCKVIHEQDFAGVTTPLLMIYCPEDKIVDVDVAQAAFAQWGGAPKKLVAFTPPESAERHVIAGDIRAPRGTQPLTEEIVTFVRSLR